MALKVSRSKRFDGFDMNELKHLAGGARLPEKLVVNVAQETVALFYDKWASEKSHLPLSRHVVETIERHLQKLPLRKSMQSSATG